MDLIGLPLDNWKHYADLFHATIAYRPGHPEFDQAVANIPAIMSELRDEGIARRRAPRHDLLTALVQLELDDGRHLSDDEVGAVLWNLVGGGLDTTTSLTSLALFHLAQAARDGDTLAVGEERDVFAGRDGLQLFYPAQIENRRPAYAQETLVR